jgi:hypothetical protein
MKKIIFIIFILSLGLNAQNWKRVADGVSYQKNIYNFEGNRTVLLHSFKIEQNRFKISIKSFHDLNRSKRVTLKDLRVENNALITISGGFYLPKKGYQSPQGLVIENRKEIFPIDKKLSGVVLIRDNYLTLLPTDEVKKAELKRVDYAIQGYPRVIDPINRIGIRKQGNYFHRTALCTEMKNHDIILFITDKKYKGITLLELAKIAKDSSNFNCEIAVNLDGGPAPAISVSPKLINLEIKEGWQLPNAIIFSEK